MTKIDEQARLAVEGYDEELAMTTLGPLGDYGLEVISGAREAYNDNAPFAGIKTRVVDTQSESLATLAALPGFVYLGSPYSKYALGHDVAAYVVSVSATQLMARGLRVYYPITHGHFVNKHGKLPQTWTFWKEQCQPMIDAASSLVALMMDGWEESVGLIYEIGEFERAGKPVVYVDPGALNDRSQNTRVAEASDDCVYDPMTGKPKFFTMDELLRRSA